MLHKEYPWFVKMGMMSWTNSLLDNHPAPAYAGAIRRIINFHPRLFPYLVLVGEDAVGVGLTLGFLTPISALVAALLNFNYIAVAGVRPKYITVNNCFRVDQGQNFVVIIAEIVIFFSGAGAVRSIDSILRIFLMP